MKRCQHCKRGISSIDPSGAPYIVCALIPPAPVPVTKVNDNQLVTEIAWVRPSMALRGWCGQFKLSWLKILRRG